MLLVTGTGKLQMVIFKLSYKHILYIQVTAVSFIG